jgi:DNA-binding transcriptional ArsR family regulator
VAGSGNTESQLAAVEAVFAAVAHAARRHILLVVHFRGGSMTAGEIARRFGCSWPTTSRHLRVLEAAGLLSHEKQGRTRVYRIDKSKLRVMQRWLDWFERQTGDQEDRFNVQQQRRARGRRRPAASQPRTSRQRDGSHVTRRHRRRR